MPQSVPWEASEVLIVVSGCALDYYQYFLGFPRACSVGIVPSGLVAILYVVMAVLSSELVVKVHQTALEWDNVRCVLSVL